MTEGRPRPRPRPTPSPAAIAVAAPADGIKKKRFYNRGWLWLLVFFVAVVIILVTAVSQDANDAVNTRHKVAYSVTGTVAADITYYAPDSSSKSATESVANQKLPWTKAITVKGNVAGFVLTATPSDVTKKGALACAITLDGKVVSIGKTNDTGIVSCDATGYNGK
ncbi:MAG: hypothetical protein ACR2LX_11990 [Jatrophihabitans sp.]